MATLVALNRARETGPLQCIAWLEHRTSEACSPFSSSVLPSVPGASAIGCSPVHRRGVQGAAWGGEGELPRGAEAHCISHEHLIARLVYSLRNRRKGDERKASGASSGSCAPMVALQL